MISRRGRTADNVTIRSQKIFSAFAFIFSLGVLTASNASVDDDGKEVLSFCDKQLEDTNSLTFSIFIDGLFGDDEEDGTAVFEIADNVGPQGKYKIVKEKFRAEGSVFFVDYLTKHYRCEVWRDGSLVAARAGSEGDGVCGGKSKCKAAIELSNGKLQWIYGGKEGDDLSKDPKARFWTFWKPPHSGEGKYRAIDLARPEETINVTVAKCKNSQGDTGYCVSDGKTMYLEYDSNGRLQRLCEKKLGTKTEYVLKPDNAKAVKSDIDC